MTLSEARQQPNPIASAPVIEVRGLQKRYGKLTAIKGIDFSVEPGEIFGLIGPDGAGKTSTFHILAGVMEATAGQVRILGQLPRDARLSLGYLTQQFSLYLDLSIDENLRYSAGLREVPEAIFAQRRTQYLRLMSLDAFGDRLAGQLSGGMKQKLALCCALVTQPQILLLDEPTTGVDPVSRREFWDVLATLATTGVTIVVATPYLDEAERCHRIALMYQGEIQQIGTLADLRQRLNLQRLEVHLGDITQLETAERVLLANRDLWSESPSDHQPTEPPQLDQPRSVIADVQTFGDRLDVLVQSAVLGEAEVRSQFAQHGLPSPLIEVLEPTLENVFVTRLRQQGSDPPFIPFPRNPSTATPPKDTIAIGATRLRKTFGSFQAVKAVNLDIRYGEIYGLLGANGAGKTTTIKMLCGLLSPTSGQMMLAGRSHNLRSRDIRRRIGYTSQKFTLYDDLTIQQNLEFYCGVYGVPKRLRRDRIHWVLATCGLEGQEDLLTGRLPQGWKQRVAFGASVMHEPEILFLDEPTSGVDPLARRQFWRLIEEFARRGTAILVTTHYLEEAEHCNRMGFLVAGEVVAQGTPGQIKAEQPGQLLELIVSHTQRASDLLKTQVEPWRISIFGDRLHVVVEKSTADLDDLRHLLRQNDIDLHSVRPISFSLEDAFIGIVQRSQANPE